MKINLDQYTIATPEVAALRDFWTNVLGPTAAAEDHGFYHTLQDEESGGCLAVVPHNGDEKWDHPWITLATDDLAGAIEHLKSLGVTSIENSGPTDEDGNPIACVTFRDPEGRLIMLATSR